MALAARWGPQRGTELRKFALPSGSLTTQVVVPLREHPLAELDLPVHDGLASPIGPKRF